MAIKFGDTIENQNTAYPIVDVVGDNVAGVHIVDDFANDHLIAIPVNARRTGSIVVAKDTGKVYIFKGTGNSIITGNNDSGNEWGHPAGTNWIPAGSTTLGSPSSGTLIDNSPAIASFTANTLIVDAIDQLNETLGALVPTAPQTFATQVAGANSEWVVSTPSTNQNRVTNTAHTVNGLGSLSAGDIVNWRNGNTALSQTVLTSPTADLKNVQYQAKLTKDSLDDVTATLAADDSDDTVTTSDLTLTKVTEGFPTSGSGEDFYTGVTSLAWSYTGTSFSVGYHRLRITEDGTTNIDKLWYQESNSVNSIAISSEPNEGKVMSSTLTPGSGAAYYYSSGIKYCGNNDFTMNITCTVVDIVPSDAKIYGATTNNATDFNWAVGNSHGCFAAGTSLAYTDHPDVTSNTSVAPGLADYTFGKDVPLQSLNAISDLSDSSNGPRYDFKSVHGNLANQDFNTSTAFYLMQFSDRTQSESDSLVMEDSISNGVGSTDGIRVAEPSGSTYTNDPSGALGDWSRQFGNNQSGSLNLDVKDAMVLPDGVQHVSGTDYSNTAYLPADTNNPDTTSGRSGSQFATFKIALDTNNVAQKIKLFVNGTFDTILVKTFDSSTAPTDYSLETAASATNGWLSCHVTKSSAVTDEGVPSAGVADGAANVLDGNETDREVTLDAGASRWGYASHIYVRIKLDSGDKVSKLGLRSV